MNLRRYILVVFFTISLSSCGGNPVHFDEAQWRRDVEKQSIEKLYAPHFKDGEYFNPWMPIERGRFSAPSREREVWLELSCSVEAFFLPGILMRKEEWCRA